MINERLNKRRKKAFNKKTLSGKMAMIKRLNKKFSKKKNITEQDKKFISFAKSKIVRMVE